MSHALTICMTNELMKAFEQFMENKVSLLEYYSMLEKHDWYYYFSDDNRVYYAGETQENKLEAMRHLSPEHDKLWCEFKSYMFTGEPWKNERKPKPERPKE